MSVVHNHPHPKAMQVVTPSNVQIFRKFGKVRIEDWSDRVMQGTWKELQSRTPEIQSYLHTADQTDSVVPADDEIVACHTIRTGERVLLHNDWLQ